MKNIFKNKKGFTLIELLAVIVILAILVMVAIPAVTKYLNYSRQGTFADNAKSAISAVRNDVIMKGYTSDCYYDRDEINKLLERKLETSPFGMGYSAKSYVLVEFGSDKVTYSMCLVDEDKKGNPVHGFSYKDESSSSSRNELTEAEIDDTRVLLSGATQCVLPSDGHCGA